MWVHFQGLITHTDRRNVNTVYFNSYNNSIIAPRYYCFQDAPTCLLRPTRDECAKEELCPRSARNLELEAGPIFFISAVRVNFNFHPHSIAAVVQFILQGKASKTLSYLFFFCKGYDMIFIVIFFKSHQHLTLHTVTVCRRSIHYIVEISFVSTLPPKSTTSHT